jgi:hypothetical protein
MHPDHTFPFNIYKIHSNVIFPSTPIFPICPFPSDKNYLGIFLLSHACYMPSQSHSRNVLPFTGTHQCSKHSTIQTSYCGCQRASVSETSGGCQSGAGGSR